MVREHVSVLLRSRGLRWGGAVAALIAVVMTSLFALITSEATGMLTRGIDRSLAEQLSLLAARPIDMLPFMITSRMGGGAAVITQVGLFSGDRAPIVGTLHAIPPGLLLDSRAHRAIGADDSAPIRAAGRQLPDGSVLVVARDASDVIEIYNDLFSAGLRLALPTLALTLASGLIMGLYSEKRLRRVNETAELIISGDMTLRLPSGASGDELDRLCATFNRILTRLEEGIDALRNAGENIAHDLRTPLTAVRAKLERSGRLAAENAPVAALIDQCVANIDQMLATITALLRIAELENVRRKSAFVPFRLDAMLRETVEVFAPMAEDSGQSLILAAEAETVIVGDRELMIEALANLIDNALKFTPKGGRVTVSLVHSKQGPEIRIADSGPGIPIEMRAPVLNRFAQLDTSRRTDGHGLGLSMVKAICQFHEFPLRIEGDQHGAVFSILCHQDAVRI
jgi:signal transduction histidine kinase